MPINPEVKVLKSKGFKTFTELATSLGKNIKPSEVASDFLNSLKGVKIKTRVYYSPEDLKKIEDYLSIPRIEKIKRTKLTKYGITNYNNREKYKQTCLDKYGFENISQLEEIKDKKKKTCLEHFEVDNPLKLESVKQKAQEEYKKNLEEIKEKIKQTCLDKYGVTSANKLKTVQIKKEATCLQHFGVKYGCLLSKPGKYIFNNVIFDSSWELSYYLYLKKNNINFQYHPTDKEFIYFDSNNKKRIYYPDFKIDNEYIEIKGDQFFDKEGNLFFPYSDNINEEIKTKNKFELMKKEKIKILRFKDLKPILKFVKDNFGDLKKYKKE